MIIRGIVCNSRKNLKSLLKHDNIKNESIHNQRKGLHMIELIIFLTLIKLLLLLKIHTTLRLVPKEKRYFWPCVTWINMIPVIGHLFGCVFLPWLFPSMIEKSIHSPEKLPVKIKTLRWMGGVVAAVDLLLITTLFITIGEAIAIILMMICLWPLWLIITALSGHDPVDTALSTLDANSTPPIIAMILLLIILMSGYWVMLRKVKQSLIQMKLGAL